MLNNKQKMFARLLNNDVTRKVILKQWKSKQEYSLTTDVMNICETNKINFYQILLQRKCPKVSITYFINNERKELVETLNECIQSWYNPTSRRLFKNIMEERVIRCN